MIDRYPVVGVSHPRQILASHTIARRSDTEHIIASDTMNIC